MDQGPPPGVSKWDGRARGASEPVTETETETVTESETVTGFTWSR